MSTQQQLSFFPKGEFLRKDVYPKDTRLWNEFMKFHTNHPEIYDYFGRAVNEAKGKGMKSIGAQQIFEYMRWYCQVDKKDRTYRINNNHFAYYARLFILKNPEYDGFFELRKLKAA